MKLLVLGLVMLLGAAGNGGGCSNPNAIGVQDYGTVVGRVLDASNNQPVGGALVSIGSIYTGTSDPRGGFVLSTIPIGEQEVTASAPGYERVSVTISVHKDRTTDAGYLRIAPLSGGPTAPPPPPPASASPIPTAVPALTPMPGSSANPTPGP